MRLHPKLHPWTTQPRFRPHSILGAAPPLAPGRLQQLPFPLQVRIVPP